jgi:predicted lipoprotein
MLAMVQSKFGSFACSRRGEGVSALPSKRGRENKRWGGILFAAATILGASLSPARADADHAAIAKASLTQVIRPGYAAFADATGAVGDKLAALCQQPSSDALNQAKDAFAGAVAAWSKVEIIRFGPVIEDHRFERLFFWPDPKGLGLKQIQDALAKQDAAVTEPDRLAGKSVALQGLPALEYLLYGDGADALAVAPKVEDGQQPLPDLDDPAQFRCSFAASVATNIDRPAKAVVEGWREGSAFEKAVHGPAPDDPNYHAPKEVTLDLFKTFTTGIELVRDQKLGKPLGASAAEAKPKLAAFWRSGLTFANAAGNLDGVKAVFAQGGFAQVVADESAGVENSILFDLDHAIAVLRGIDQPVAEVVSNEDLRAKLEALRVGLKNSAQTAGDMIAKGAGLAFGFNAMDGD